MTNGQPEDEGEEPAGRLTVNRPLALMIGSVAAGIILIFAYSGQYSEATRGLGEALVIAGLLGLTVDS